MKKIFIIAILLILLTDCSKEQNEINENINNENSCSINEVGC